MKKNKFIIMSFLLSVQLCAMDEKEKVNGEKKNTPIVNAQNNENSKKLGNSGIAPTGAVANKNGFPEDQGGIRLRKPVVKTIVNK